jgi:hypothetical protein
LCLWCRGVMETWGRWENARSRISRCRGTHCFAVGSNDRMQRRTVRWRRECQSIPIDLQAVFILAGGNLRSWLPTNGRWMVAHPNSGPAHQFQSVVDVMKSQRAVSQVSVTRSAPERAAASDGDFNWWSTPEETFSRSKIPHTRARRFRCISPCTSRDRQQRPASLAACRVCSRRPTRSRRGG